MGDPDTEIATEIALIVGTCGCECHEARRDAEVATAERERDEARAEVAAARREGAEAMLARCRAVGGCL